MRDQYVGVRGVLESAEGRVCNQPKQISLFEAEHLVDFERTIPSSCPDSRVVIPRHKSKTNSSPTVLL